MKEKLKVGDRVKLIGLEYAGYEKGDIAVVARINSKDSNQFSVYNKHSNILQEGCCFKNHWVIVDTNRNLIETIVL